MKFSLRKSVFHRRLYRWHSNAKRDFPWRNTSDLYSLLVAEILLQKTNADKVSPAYQEIIKRYPRPESLARAHLVTLRSIITPLGLVNKATILKSMAKELVRNNGEIATLDRLKRIKGVGEYIGRSVLVHSYGKRLPLLDPNFIRIYKRVFGVCSARSRPRTDKELWEKADELMPKREPSKHVYAMLDFGATVCRARNPSCSQCPMFPRVCSGIGDYVSEAAAEV